MDFNKSFEKAEEQELSLKDKRFFVDIVENLVVDEIEKPINLTEMGVEDLKEWFYQTVERDISKLIREFSLEADENLVEDIKESKNEEGKLNLQIRYIQDLYSKFDKFIIAFESEKKSGKWSSWPKSMRKNKAFNCVGATLLGMNLLKKAGIENYYALLAGHVVNIGKLADGNYYFIDFRNGKNNFIKLDAEEEEIDDIKVLEIDEDKLIYKLLVLLEEKDSVNSIINNFSSLLRVANDENIPDDNQDKIEAQAYIKENQAFFEEDSFSFLKNKLYGNVVKVVNSKEMEEERERVQQFRDLERPFQKYFKGLDKNVADSFLKEIILKKDKVLDFFENDSEDLFNDVSRSLKEFLLFAREKLAKIKKANRNIYDEFVEKMINKRF